MAKAIFLDRDGTLNEDPGYLSQPAQVKLLPKVGEALSLLKDAGFVFIVISNQSGVGRGLIPAANLPLIHDRLNELLQAWGVEILHFENCTHHPREDCGCRKPKPELILRSAQKLGIQLEQSFMVGDRLKDLEAGRAAGCKSVALVTTGDIDSSELKEAKQLADFVGDSLKEVAQWILDSENGSL